MSLKCFFQVSISLFSACKFRLSSWLSFDLHTAIKQIFLSHYLSIWHDIIDEWYVICMYWVANPNRGNKFRLSVHMYVRYVCKILQTGTNNFQCRRGCSRLFLVFPVMYAVKKSGSGRGLGAAATCSFADSFVYSFLSFEAPGRSNMGTKEQSGPA